MYIYIYLSYTHTVYVESVIDMCILLSHLMVDIMGIDVGSI